MSIILHLKKKSKHFSPQKPGADTARASPLKTPPLLKTQEPYIPLAKVDGRTTRKSLTPSESRDFA